MHAPGYIGDDDSGGTPTDGGTLTFGTFNFPRSLDPTHTRASGAVGGTEMAAIYDVLLRRDEDNDGEYDPQLARGVEHNDDYSRFTITLRPDATFSDGTPVDADAVKWSIERYLDSGFDLAPTMKSAVQNVTVPDEHTVVFDLTDPWPEFPVLLTAGAGYIVAPSSVTGGTFTPIGAGPYTVDNFSADEELDLQARDGYYGGRPHIDALRFVPGTGSNEQLDSLRAGQVNMIYLLQDRQVIQDAIDSGVSGYLAEMGLGQDILINQREGRPGADVRVRKAIAYGIDRDAYVQRVQDGLGNETGEILPPGSQWHTDVKGIGYDPDKAKKLLDEAKADGYDGKISLETATDPFSMSSAQTIQASLNAVGFDCTLDTAPSPAAGAQMVFNLHDFDLSRQSFAALDEAPYIRLAGSLGSDSGNNPGAYSDQKTDKLLADLQSAPNNEATDKVLGDLQQQINDTVPYVILGPMAAFTGWDDSVHGLKRTTANIWLFNDAWVS